MRYITKDSGKRVKFKSGMNRDTTEGKPRYDLIIGETQKDNLITRWAELMARGAEKYGERNWEKANSIEELNRFKASAWRHFVSAMQGDEEEDHYSATCFNLNAIIYLHEKLNKGRTDKKTPKGNLR